MNTAGHQRKKDSVPSQAALDRLIGFLDPDPGIARQKLEKITAKLTKFFQWRGCATPDEFASKTIVRVAQQLAGRDGLQMHNPSRIFHAVAVDLLKHQSTYPEKEPLSWPGLVDTTPLTDTVKPEAPGIEAVEPERLRQCLQDCLSLLPRESLELITKYHSHPNGLSKEAREKLAQSVGIPENALRMRVFTIRSSLETCVKAVHRSSIMNESDSSIIMMPGSTNQR